MVQYNLKKSMHLQQEGASFNNLFAHCGSLFPFDYKSKEGLLTVLFTVLNLIEVSLSKKRSPEIAIP